jgi:hypothetical protein
MSLVAKSNKTTDSLVRSVVKSVSSSGSSSGSVSSSVSSSGSVSMSVSSSVSISGSGSVSSSVSMSVSISGSVSKSGSVSLLEALPENVFYYILEFVDKPTLYMNLQLASHQIYNMLSVQSVINHRLMVLNKSVDHRYGSNLMIDTYGHKEFNQLLCRVLNNHQPTLAFIDELLSVRSNGTNYDSPFYIGGSIAVMMAHMLQSKEFDLDSYTNSDIDIYCIGDHNVNEIQKVILNAILNSFQHISHHVVLKRFIIDIVFEDPTARKIQIILHMKANLDEHMVFVDLPITQILLGGSVSKLKPIRHIYKTRLAQYAIDHKLNIVTDPIHQQTHNRIVKYMERGFTTVVHGIGQLYCIGHPNSKIISIFDTKYNRYYVDMELREVFDVLEIISTPVLYTHIMYQLPVNSETILENTRTNRVILSEVFKGVIDTPLFRVLSHQQKLFKFVSNKETKSVRQRIEYIDRRHTRRRYSGYGHYDFSDSDDDDEYEQVVVDYNCLSRVRKTKFSLATFSKYKYRHNEQLDTFENLQNKLKVSKNESYYYPFYFPMNICEIPKLSESLFFKTFNSYFLNKSFCALKFDGSYGYKKFVCSLEENIIESTTIDNVIRKYTEDEYKSFLSKERKERKKIKKREKRMGIRF